MLSKTALKRYNREDTVIVVASYPDVNNGVFDNVSGVATYTYHMLPAFLNHLAADGRRVVVLADVINDKQEGFVDDGVLIYRCWRRKHPKVFSDLFTAIKSFNEVEKLFINFEFNMFADAFVTALFPLLLLKLRLMRKNTTLLLHQVVSDLSSLSGHLNMGENSLLLKLFNLVLQPYFWLIVNLSRKVIVHDKVLKDRLQKVSAKPIFVVPHGLGEYKNVCSLIDARQKLGLSKSSFVVLCFGFLTWYKGSDWIIDQFIKYYNKTGDDSVKLLMAGGKSATFRGKPHYEKYYAELLEKIEKYPNIIITGFVPDEDVKYMFCAADVVALPYRTQMSASGPFAIGLSFDRPFLLSENLSGVLETDDVKESMRKYDLTAKDITFKLTQGGLFSKITTLMDDKKSIKSLYDLSADLNEERQWEKITSKFLYIIDA